jgi:hypothetical protein
MKSEVRASLLGATGRVVVPSSRRSAELVATRSGVLSRQVQASALRNGLSCRLRQQGRSAGRWSRPNPRLQAARPGAQLLGSLSVAHDRAMRNATAVMGARLKRSVRQRMVT